jgi:hypothetical protein
MLAIDDIFRLWPSNAQMARDLGIPYATVAKWVQRERIPSDAWGAVINAALAKGKRLTFSDLAAANKPRKGFRIRPKKIQSGAAA